MILPDLITEKAQQTPNKTAFIFRDQSLSYAAIEKQVRACAKGLAALGVTKGTTFGLVLRNSPEFVITVMALGRLGAVAVPINFMEKPERIALILNDAKAMGVITAKEFLRAVSQAVEKVPSVKHLFIREGTDPKAASFETLLKEGALEKDSVVQPGDLLMLLYTSGTTGLPKGVMLTHKNFLANMEQCLGAIDLKAKDRFLCLLPMFHSFAWTTCVLIPLKIGGPCVINESLLPFDPVIKAIWKHKVTVFVAVPQIYSALTAKIKGFKAFVLRLLSPVRLAIAGAAPLPIPVHKGFEKTFGIPLLQGYGLTETSPVATLNPTKTRKKGTVGPALPGVRVDIRDDEGKAVAQNEVGEIWIQGDNVMQGYYNKPTETSEVLTQDKWLKSGDMGKMDHDGFVTIVDRKKDLIIIKGLNVYPQEVENVISQHANVQEVAVVGKMNPDTGEETIRAFVTLKDKNKGIDKAEIIGMCRKDLAPYKRPKDVTVLDEMPKNALQKILKKELRKL